MRRRGRLALLLMLSIPAGAAAQEAPSCGADGMSPWTYVRDCVAPLIRADTTDMKHAMEDAFETAKSPESLNADLGEVESLTRTRNLFDGLHLHFVTVQEEGDAQTLGLAYEWDRDIVRTPHRQGTFHHGYDLAFSSEGTLTPDADENPEPVLSAMLYPHVFLGIGGALDSAALAGHLSTVQDSILEYESVAALRDSDALSGLLAAVWDSLSTQAYLTGGVEGRYETDQLLDRDQWAYGLRFGFDVKAWRPSSALARANVFDWPAALVRWASGVDGGFRPSGAAIPTLALAFHRVSPDDHPERLALDGLDDYSRVAIEADYRSLLTRTDAGRVWLEMGYRHHSEIDPSAAIEAADLHQFDRFFVRLHSDGGFTVSWATGRLPLDPDDADVYGIGFRFRF